MKRFYFVLRCIRQNNSEFLVNGDGSAAKLTMDFIEGLQNSTKERYGLLSALLVFITEVKD